MHLSSYCWLAGWLHKQDAFDALMLHHQFYPGTTILKEEKGPLSHQCIDNSKVQILQIEYDIPKCEVLN